MNGEGGAGCWLAATMSEDEGVVALVGLGSAAARRGGAKENFMKEE